MRARLALDYPSFFRTLTGVNPYCWQERVADHLFDGRSVIVRVPTGAGKTWGAVAPFLHALKSGDRLMDRLIYALPLRSLASSLHSTVLEKMSPHFEGLKQTGKDRDYTAGTYCSLQIGGQKNDPFLESDLVFTTIDQLLSSYILMPLSLSDRLANMNAGAIVGSLIVIDEMHLLDPTVALGTLIEMLSRLKKHCQFVLMTATMSDAAISWLERKLEAVSVAVTDNEIRALPSQRTKVRTWFRRQENITAALVQASHNGGRTIALFNSVARAQDLYCDLKRLYDRPSESPKLLLLHSRFYQEDRQKIEAQLADYFGPDATSSDVILVATQVVEAGIDISADQLHTEIAPMNALIQRAGRTARYEQRCFGSVFVYNAPGLGPYNSEKSAVAATESALSDLPSDGLVADFVRERAWIADVHEVAELAQLQLYDNLHVRSRMVLDAIEYGDKGMLGQLVRDVASVNVLISDNPEAIPFERRNWPRTLSVPGMSLLSLSSRFRNLRDGEWVAKGATEESDDGSRTTNFRWTPIPTARGLMSNWLLALHPDHAAYTSELGLQLGVSAPMPALEFNEPAPTLRFQYQFEPWTVHSQRVVAQARQMRRSYQRGTESLARELGVSVEIVDELVDVVCALHDTGKLRVDWQAPAWRWQRFKDNRLSAEGVAVPDRPQVPIAHTTMDSAVDRSHQRKPDFKLPHHSVEGAFAVSMGIFEAFNAAHGALAEHFAIAVVTAIARHHTRNASEVELFQVQSEPPAETFLGLGPRWSELKFRSCLSRVDASDFKTELLTLPRDAETLPLYGFLVRRLRLADQASLAQTHLN